MASKPYRIVGGWDQAPDEADYKDLIRTKSTLSAAQVDTMAADSGSTIFYSQYNFPLTTAGDLLGHDGASIVRFPIGTDGQFLQVEDSNANKLTWATLSLTTTKGDLLGYGSAMTRVPVGANDTVLMADSGETLGLKWYALTSAKGDVLSHNGSDPIALTVGANGTLLEAQSGETTGLKWRVGNTAKGDILTHDGSTHLKKAVGANDTLLTADSAQTTGLKWEARTDVKTFQSGLSGSWIYGDGAEGTLTLGSDTTWADADNVHAYTTVDGAGYTLAYFDDGNGYGVLLATVSITNITISCKGKSSVVNGAGGANAIPCAGGAGGRGSGAFYVFGRALDTVTVTGAGNNGIAGTDAPTTPVTLGVGGGFAATAGATYCIAGDTMTVTVPAPNNTTNIGAIQSVISGAGSKSLMQKTSKDLPRLLFGGMGLTPIMIALDQRRWCAGSASGGSAGNGKNAAVGSTYGGGGGAGGAGIYGYGGNGGNGGTGNHASALSCVCGSGGGGGGGGGHVFVICESATGVVVTASGGSGGNGSLAWATGAGVGCGGGGGGGGGGGVAVFIGPTSGATVTAAAGTDGAAGGGSGGPNGTAGGTVSATEAGKAIAPGRY